MTALSRLKPVLLGLIIMDISGARGQSPATDTVGSLHQSDVAIRMRAGNIQLHAIPLSESIIRLLRPETYRALRGTRERYAAEIESAAARWAVFSPTVLLVTVIGTVEETPFYPDQLTITSQNILRRPISVFPLSAQWSSQRLSDREPVAALYLFDGVAVWEPFVLHYEASSTDGWEDSLRALERERSRVRRGSAEDWTGWYLSLGPGG